MWEDIFKDWLIWKDTALTNHSTLRHSRPTQILNRNQARQSLFLSGQPDRYLAESTDNQDKILLPGETIIKTVDEKVYRSIKEENYRGIPVRNIFDAPTRGILLPWNLRMSWKKDLGIHPGLLLMDLSRPLNSGMVVEDHGSTEGVTLTLKFLETYIDGTTTILLSTLNKQHESPDKSISDRKTHSVLHKSEQLLPFKLTTNTTNHPWKNGTTQRIHSEIGNYSLQHLDTTQKAKQAPKQERFFSRHQILYPRPPIITICFSERPNPPLFSNPPRLLWMKTND